jgi:hypothetical protein
VDGIEAFHRILRAMPLPRARVSSLLLVITVVGCHTGIDQAKFDRVYRAGKALQVEVNATGGASTRSGQLQKDFETEVAALDGRAQGPRELDAFRAFTEASDAFKFLLRFRSLDLDAAEGKSLVMGSNVQVAMRYHLSIETRGDSQWVDSATALKVMHEAAERTLREANRLVNQK